MASDARKRGVLITGVPGFIGKRLTAALAERGESLFLLCERRFEAQTHTMVEALAARAGAPAALRERCTVVPGDITEEGLGIAEPLRARIRDEVGHVYHLAAIYDLAVPEGIARKVNVEGTRNVLALCESLTGVELSYVSTCYVAGDRTGMVFEDELERGQRFKNHYESTKFEAEVLVRRAMDRIPTRIFRPSIVIGDSRTGETDKFDGPYFAFRAILMGMLLVKPGAAQAPVNLVPVDFIIDALVRIPLVPGTLGKTFALADPWPLRASDLIDEVSDRLSLPRPFAQISPAIFERAMRFGSLGKRLGIPVETLAYFNTKVYFDTTNARTALAATGGGPPRLPTYLNAILRYYVDRADVPFSLRGAAKP